MLRREILQQMGSWGLFSFTSSAKTLASPLALSSAAIPPVASSNIFQMIIVRAVSRSVAPLSLALSKLEQVTLKDPYTNLVDLAHGIRSAMTATPNEALIRRYLGPDMHRKLGSLVSGFDNESFAERLASKVRVITLEEGAFVPKPSCNLPPRSSSTKPLSKGSVALQQVRSSQWVAHPPSLEKKVIPYQEIPASTSLLPEDLRQALAPIDKLASTLRRLQKLPGNLFDSKDPASTAINGLFELIKENRWPEVFSNHELSVIIRFQNLWNYPTTKRSIYENQVRTELKDLGLDPQRLEFAEATRNLSSSKKLMVKQVLFTLSEAENFFLDSKRIGSFPEGLAKTLKILIPALEKDAHRNSLLSCKINEAKVMLKNKEDGDTYPIHSQNME